MPTLMLPMADPSLALDVVEPEVPQHLRPGMPSAIIPMTSRNSEPESRAATLTVMESKDGASESIEAKLRALQGEGREPDQASRYDLPLKLSHGSLGAIEEVFGEQLVFGKRGLNAKDVAAAPQARLNELVELHEWASFWGAQGIDADRWMNTYRSELSGRLLVPAARTLNAGVSMAMYADTVLLPDC
ncbi:hypothetical protein [Arthrobacter sp. H14-L1]|uniref:hypothetical protein n=1 Tax=Arthrobacter sp. H14-L1 TaxID=2996697 RepID=UPI002270C5DA|nr:hypothetical protein [Arthrobacter sp. H14-L1]MCY0903644.1 hypothetical protein [Arthrobacter sp. H14-L1]